MSIDKLREFNVKGNVLRNSKASRRTIEKRCSAYDKGDIFHKPNDFGFSKIHLVVEIH